ncbi:DUF4349 domain-containing protein [Hymenobacter metallilatus]|uniref:DUF4349 domain-containing protein n=1 Tax=Hymenobacter metallilatus TaxID=2493666 RepID=A0A3R9M7U7_9BACT|nr:DUF4349 domain-containing protein [Hymenobacter metallilatus]RSK34625.1 DUF4349 domain-containing protein [Hymenobacter metallilatus]
MRTLPFVGLFLLTGLLSCNRQQEAKESRLLISETEATESAAEEISDKALMAPPPPLQAPGPGDASAGTADPATAQPPASRKLVYHAEVKMKVADLPRTNARMDSLTRALGAYVQEVAENREDAVWQHRMKIRVTPGRFQALLRGLGRLGTVEQQELTTDDVTAQHADISARLRSKRALEQRYLALLGKATKVSDILEIEENMGEIRENIEATESRLLALNDEVGFSTVTLEYYQPLTLPTPDRPVLSFGSRLVESFYNGWQLLIDLLLGLITIWPLLLGLAGGVGLLRWWWQRRRARRAA